MKPIESSAPNVEPQEEAPSPAKTPGRAVSGRRLRHALLAGTLAWMFGNVWFAAISGSAFTLFAKSMNASPFQFGLFTALQYLAALVSLPASLLIERTGKRKQIFFMGHYFQRSMWFVLALAPYWIMSRYGVGHANVALNLFIPLLFLMYAGGAVGGPGWVSWMADVVPERIRALLLAPAAVERVDGATGGVVYGVAARSIRRRRGGRGRRYAYHHALVYDYFLCAAVFGVMDIAMFHLVPDVPQAPQRTAGLLKAMARPLKDKNYLWFAGYVATLQFAFVPMAQYLTLYAMDKAELKNRDVQLMMLVLPMVAQFIVLPVWGRAADRMGKKPLLVVATLGLAPVGVAWCFMGKESTWVGYLLASLGTALWTGVEVANLNIVLEMSGSADDASKNGGTAYHAVNSVILSMAAVLGGLAWGGIAQWLKDWHWTPIAGWKTLSSFDVMFIFSGLLRLTAVVVFLPRLHEPDARPTREALRFMGVNIYNNVFSTLAQPLRFFTRDKGEERKT